MAKLLIRANSWVFGVLLAIVLLAPVPFASVKDWTRLLVGALIAGCAVIWLFLLILEGRKLPLTQIKIPAALFGIFLIWCWFQCFPLGVAELIHPIWSLAAQALGRDLPGSIGLSCDRGREQLFYYISGGLFFLMMVDYAREEGRARILLIGLSLSGLANALYGLILFWFEIEKILWFDKVFFLDDVTGTFIYRNNFATYLGLIFLCVMALLAQRISGYSFSGPGRNLRRQRLLEALFQRWSPYLVGLFLLFAALMGTHSRGGFVSMLISVLVFIALLVVKSKNKDRGAGLGSKLIFPLVGILILSGILAGGATTLSRLDDSSLASSSRDEAYQLTWIAIEANPSLGYGVGSYVDAFKMYQGAGNQLHLPAYFKAHNSYLELAFEVGLPAAALFMAGFFLLVMNCLIGVLKRRKDWHYPALAVAASLLIGSHSLVDFPFQIPAIALTYLAILAVGVGQSYSSKSRRALIT